MPQFRWEQQLRSSAATPHLRAKSLAHFDDRSAASSYCLRS
jgi:hypothetical protein